MLTQAEADALIAMEKRFSEGDAIAFPTAGETIQRMLVSTNRRERFVLDVHRASIKLTKCTCQTRGRTVVVLVRLDIDGRTHTNPDQTSVGPTHIHLYREGFGDKWAFQLPLDRFQSPGNLVQTLRELLDYCNVVDAPSIEGGLF